MSSAKTAQDEGDWIVWGLVSACRFIVALIIGIYASFMVNLEAGIGPASSGVHMKVLLIGIGLSVIVAYQVVTVFPLDNESVTSKVFSVISAKTGTVLPFVLQVLL